MRVLQIEDDVSTAQAVAKTLEAKGFQCDTASLGEDAIGLATQNRYDLILLDIMLPDIDGYEVLRRLRDADIHTPVVIQSALLGDAHDDQGAGLGIQDHLIKPFNGHDLRECVNSILERAGSEDLGHIEVSVPVPDDRREAERRGGDATRRRHLRVKTLKGGQIIYKNSNCVTDCLVVNMSPGGAALKLSKAEEVPETFLLKLKQGSVYRCHVCWRHGEKLGVMFIQPSG
jgi:DNA-binding response OmpR family regulator